MMNANAVANDAITEIATIVHAYESLSLPELLELDEVVLLDRVDIKYLMRPQQILQALAAIQPYYQVLEINQVRLQQYQTLYFDTQDFVLYKQHHNDARSRYKIRFRTYVNSNLTFLEVKLKNNKDRTIKNRIPVADATAAFDEAMQAFLRTMQPFEPQALAPRISNSFIRITLVRKDAEERLTLDLNIQFDDDDASTLLPAIAVAEVKQNHYSRLSPFIHQVRLMGGCEIGITKYCIGAARRYPFLKANNFKAAFLQMDKLAKHPN